MKTKIYLLKKQKNRIYKSEDIIFSLWGKKISHNEDGAPQIENGYVSITDTKNYWACAFSDEPIGIDMEEQNRQISTSVVKKLHRSEREYLSVLSEGSSEWRTEFLNIWTKKEAYSKYLGTGLASGFSSFCVLDGLEQNLKTQVYNLSCSGLVFASTERSEIEEISYNAPAAKSALEAGADILDMFGCSSETLKKKLLDRGYSEGESTEAINTLLERGYLNDNEYSRSLAAKYAAKGYSSRRIEYELKQKNVPDNIARAWADKYKQDDYERAYAFAKKSLANCIPDDKTKAKIARKLNALGYAANVVYDIIKKLG